jgi:single-strand DNA-binding protein
MLSAITIAVTITDWSVSSGEKVAAKGQGVFVAMDRKQQVSVPVELLAFGKACDAIEEGGAYLVKGTLVPGSKPKTIAISVSSSTPLPDGPLPMFSQVTVAANVGNDFELVEFDTSSIAKASLPISGYGQNAKTSWLDVKAWNKQAELVTNYVRKGEQLVVSGSLTYESWTDRNSGEIVGKFVLNAEQIQLPPRQKKVEEMDGF